MGKSLSSLATSKRCHCQLAWYFTGEFRWNTTVILWGTTNGEGWTVRTTQSRGNAQVHQKSTGYSHNILSGEEFTASKDVLNGKAVALREQGKGKRERKANSLTEQEEETLWQHGVLGHSTPQSLNYTGFTKQASTLGQEAARNTIIQDLKFVHSPTTGEVEYVEWTQGITKTRQGGLVKTDRCVPQRMFRTGVERCPVLTI